MVFLGVLLGFLISLVISAIIIYLSAKLLGENDGFSTALLAALSGAIISALVSYFIGIGWIASLVGGIAWLIALGNLYKIGWLKSLAITIVVWIINTIIVLTLLTVVGLL